jgi:pimeloyl-ACP methyl ester carboxylesterase
MKLPLLLLLISGVSALLAGAIWLWTPDEPRNVLEAKYLKSPADMSDVAGVRLRVRVSGPNGAPAIIFLHGFGSSLETWEPWSDVLRETYRVIRLDLPGSGLSPPDPTGDYTDRRTIHLLLALMDKLGVQKATLVGNSIGGRIAWTFAAEHPDRVSKLILISPDGFASPGFAYGEAPKTPAALAIMEYVLPRFILKANLAPSYGDPKRLSTATIDRYYDLIRAPGVRAALLSRMRQTILKDPKPFLMRIQAPVLLIWGQKDQMIPYANSADYLHALPHARLVAFPQLGHTPQEEAPAETLPAVQAFLAEGQPRG